MSLVPNVFPSRHLEKTLQGSNSRLDRWSCSWYEHTQPQKKRWKLMLGPHFCGWRSCLANIKTLTRKGPGPCDNSDDSRVAQAIWTPNHGPSQNDIKQLGIPSQNQPTPHLQPFTSTSNKSKALKTQLPSDGFRSHIAAWMSSIGASSQPTLRSWHRSKLVTWGDCQGRGFLDTWSRRRPWLWSCCDHPWSAHPARWWSHRSKAQLF